MDGRLLAGTSERGARAKPVPFRVWLLFGGLCVFTPSAAGPPASAPAGNWKEEIQTAAGTLFLERRDRASAQDLGCPLYPGARVVGSGETYLVTDIHGTRVALLARATLSTKDSVDKVAAFYRKRLSAPGWQRQAEPAHFGFLVGADSRAVTISSAKGGTSIALQRAIQPNATWAKLAPLPDGRLIPPPGVKPPEPPKLPPGMMREMERGMNRGLAALGIETPIPPSQEAMGKGLLVSKVLADSPAARAGVQVGDVLTKFGGLDIRIPRDLFRAMGQSRGQEDAPIQVLRGEQTLDLTLRDLKLPPIGPAPEAPPLPSA